jgi:hypothetical protein
MAKQSEEKRERKVPALQKIQFECQGVTDVITHNVRLANRFDYFYKEMHKLTAKGQKKTDADYAELARLEFTGGCYYDEVHGFYIPDVCIEAALQTACGRCLKGGKKVIASGVIADGHGTFTFAGPKTPEARWVNPACFDQRMAVVGKARIMRTRPLFTDWSMTITLIYDDTKVNRETLIEAMEIWGHTLGSFEMRPKYGRFNVIGIKDL